MCSYLPAITVNDSACQLGVGTDLDLQGVLTMLAVLLLADMVTMFA